MNTKFILNKQKRVLHLIVTKFNYNNYFSVTRSKLNNNNYYSVFITYFVCFHEFS